MAEEVDFDAVCDRLAIPENLRKHIAPGAPARGKTAVARGMLPMPPKTMLSMAYFLVGDPDPGVAGEAEKHITAMPAERLVGLIDFKTHPKILEFVAYRRPDEDRLLERIVLMRQINDKTLCFLAEKGPERVTEIISNNQERLIITPQVIRFLERNSVVSQALVDRVRSFQRLQGIVVEELSSEEREQAQEAREVADAAELEEARQRGDLPPEAAAPASPVVVQAPAEGAHAEGLPPAPGAEQLEFEEGEVYIPPAPTEAYTAPVGLDNPLAALLADWGIAADPNFVMPPAGPQSDVAGPPILSAPAKKPARADIDVEGVDLSGLTSLATSDFQFGFREDQEGFGGDLVGDVEGDDAQKQSIANAIAGMTTGQKIKLAYKGNKTVRELLVRDTNKIVAVAVVKSGRITENEVMTIASNRSINEDCIRALTENREYLRKYPVKLALALNPKTPIPTAITLLKALHVKDLKGLANNRNVSSAVFTAATRLYKMRNSAMR